MYSREKSIEIIDDYAGSSRSAIWHAAEFAKQAILANGADWLTDEQISQIADSMERRMAFTDSLNERNRCIDAASHQRAAA